MNALRWTPEQRKLRRAVKQLGTRTAVAQAMQVTPVTVWRWLAGQRPVSGLAVAMLDQILKHPEDFEDLYETPRGLGRPRKTEERTT